MGVVLTSRYYRTGRLFAARRRRSYTVRVDKITQNKTSKPKIKIEK